jgi:predicted DNA-binding protein
MKPQKSKSFYTYPIRISDELASRLNTMCDKTQLDKSVIIRIALDKFLVELEKSPVVNSFEKMIST